MRKFVMAAALLAVAACGDKPKPADAPAGAVTTVGDSTMKADSMKRVMARDSIVKDSLAKDSAMKASMAKPPAKKP
jgi:hypothetical protein